MRCRYTHGKSFSEGDDRAAHRRPWAAVHFRADARRVSKAPQCDYFLLSTESPHILQPCNVGARRITAGVSWLLESIVTIAPD